MKNINKKLQKTFLVFSVLVSFLVCNKAAYAADGDRDPNFLAGMNGADNEVYATAVQPDGKVVIGGFFTLYGGNVSRNYIARLNADGTLDTTFDPGTGANSYVRDIALQSDGKIIIGGDFTSYNGTTSNHIARLNSDGSLDGTFAPTGTGFSDDIAKIIVQSDGDILVGGYFGQYNGIDRPHIARVNSDGTLDSGFDPGTGLNANVYDIDLQSDGKALIVGNFTSYNGVSSNRIARINTNGTLDATFNIGTGANNAVYAAAVQTDGKVIIGADSSMTYFNGSSSGNVLRLNTDGTLDSTFSSGTGRTTGDVDDVAIQSDGKVLISGYISSYNGTSYRGIVRTNSDGSVDSGFDTGTGANGYYPDVLSMFIQSDGKVVIGGAFDGFNEVSKNFIARINSDGSLDNAFNPGVGSGSNDEVRSVISQPDGKIIIGGIFTRYEDIARNYIARINTDGTLDTTFDPGTGASDYVQALALQPDGKIIVAGSFSSYNGTVRNRIARINSDGTLDTSFDPGTGANSTVQSVIIQPNGKIIISGNFTSYAGTARSRIARINSDGSLDTSFNPGAGGNNTIFSMAYQSDGKIIIGGSFTTYAGTARNRIARVNADGTLDTSFNPGTGVNNSIWTMGLQPDGKILIGGIFATYNGTSRSCIARINADGSLDTSFDPGAGASSHIYDLDLQFDGKVVIGGSFASYNGTARNDIARINTDGSLDGTFDPGEGSDGYVNAVSIQSDGNVVIGGGFSYYGNEYSTNITRVLSSYQVISPYVSAESSVVYSSGTSATATGSILATGGDDPERMIEWGTSSGNYTDSCSAGTGSVGSFSCNLTGLTKGETYYVRSKATNSAGTSYGDESSYFHVNPYERYWIGDGGNWNDTSHWSNTSGGSGGASVPGGQDNAIFDANSITSSNQKVLFPVAGSLEDKLILNFDGADGATTWTEEAQGLDPDYIRNTCELDTAKANSGASSLRIVANTLQSGGVDYQVPGIGSEFTYTSYFQFHDVDNWADPFYVWDNDGSAWLEVELYESGGNKYLGIWGVDAGGNNFPNYDEITDLSMDAWHKLEVIASGRDIAIKIDNIEVETITAIIDDPMAGIDYVESWNGNRVLGNDLWMDAVTLANGTGTNNLLSSLDTQDLAYLITMNSIGETDPWNLIVSSGTIDLYDTTLINSQASGGATFNASVSNGNVDGGGNTGWDFSALAVSAPTISASEPVASSITSTTATVTANISATGGEDPERIIEWGKTSGAYTDSCTAGTGSTGDYSCDLTGLTPETIYYVRPSATNSAGTSTGMETSFTTAAAGPITAPTLQNQSSSDITSITSSGATASVTVTDAGGENQTTIIRWGTESGTYTGSCTAGTGGAGTYSCNITGLTPETIYYVIAESTNSAGTTDGNEISFTTSSEETTENSDESDSHVNRMASCKPGKFVAKGISSKKVALTWKDKCDDEKGYQIERKKGNGKFKKIAKVKKNKEDYTDDGLEPGTKYEYRVRAYDDDDESDYSNTDTARTDEAEGDSSTDTETQTDENSQDTDTTIITTTEDTTPADTTTTTEDTNTGLGEDTQEDTQDNNSSETTTDNTGETINEDETSLKDEILQSPLAKKAADSLGYLGMAVGALMAVASSAAPLLASSGFGQFASTFTIFDKGAAAATEFSGATAPASSAPSGRYGFFGILVPKKKKEEWGRVFDIDTHKPVAGVTVSILNSEERVMDSVTTNEEGKFGFLAKPGEYTFRISRNGYDLDVTDDWDEFYGKVYVGNPLKVGEDEIAEINIALRSTETDWLSAAQKKVGIFMKALAVSGSIIIPTIFYACFAFSIFTLYYSPSAYNAVVVGLYVVIAAYNLLVKAKKYGLITDWNGKPLPFTMVGVYAKNDPETRLAFAVSDVLGRYFILAPDGKYIVKMRGRELGGRSFRKAFYADVDNGVLKKNVHVKKEDFEG